MVKQIKGFQISDGRIFDNESDATLAEVSTEALRFFLDNGCNEGQANKLIAELDKLVYIVQPLMPRKSE
jgi:hypothetical protein